MFSRTAGFFNKLAKHSAEGYSLRRIVAADKARQEHLIQHKDELERIYGLIRDSAEDGGIRVILNSSDPVWANEVVCGELRQMGFHVQPGSYSNGGSIEWWHEMK